MNKQMTISGYFPNYITLVTRNIEYDDKFYQRKEVYDPITETVSHKWVLMTPNEKTHKNDPVEVTKETAVELEKKFKKISKPTR